MKTDVLLGTDLLKLQRRKGQICVSVIVPTHRLSPDREGDELRVRHAISKAKEMLKEKFNLAEKNPYSQGLDELVKKIDFTHNLDGVGLFVSDNVKERVNFSFPVEEKVIVGKSFEVRDVLYQVNHSKPYYALLITGKEARLFEGSLETLREIRDEKFPLAFEDDYYYSYPSRGTSYAGQVSLKAFEKDKSEMEKIRHNQFLKNVDELLGSYVVHTNPLVVAGVPRLLSGFKKITRHADNLAGTIEGNFTYSEQPELEKKIWEVVKGFIGSMKKELLNEYQEKVGGTGAVEGITQSWKAAKEGRAFKLLVQRNYREPGYILPGEDYRLYLKPPAGNSTRLEDAVDDLIETVLEKDGEVYFLDKEQMEPHQHVAMITRY